MKSTMKYLLSIAAQIALTLFLIWAVSKAYGAGVAEVVGVLMLGALGFSAWAWYPRKQARKLEGTLALDGRSFDPLVSRKGRSPLADKIERTGAKPGETVAIDEHGDARVIGRKPSLAVDNSK